METMYYIGLGELCPLDKAYESRLTGNLGTGTHFSGKRVDRALGVSVWGAAKE
jgi:hypothetical protein